MKVRDNTKIFIRICLAIILVAVAFLVYKLHFKGSDVDFINYIDKNTTISVKREATLLSENRTHLGDEITTYILTGEDAENFKECFSSFKMRKLLRSKTSVKNRDDFVYYHITFSDGVKDFYIRTHGDYLNMHEYTIFTCKVQSKNWRDKLDAVLANAEIVEHRVETPEHLK